MTYTADAYNYAIPVSTDPAGEATYKELQAIKAAINGLTPLAANRILKHLRFNAAGTAIELYKLPTAIVTSGVGTTVVGGTADNIIATVSTNIANLATRLVSATCVVTLGPTNSVVFDALDLVTDTSLEFHYNGKRYVGAESAITGKPCVAIITYTT